MNGQEIRTTKLSIGSSREEVRTKRKEERHWERAKKREEYEKEGQSHSYRLRFAFVVSYPVVSWSSGVSSNPKSRHSLSGAEANLSAKSQEVAIKLTSEKKDDGVVNFLSSLLPGSFSLFLSFFLLLQGCILQTDCTLEPKCVSLLFVLASETTLHTLL